MIALAQLVAFGAALVAVAAILVVHLARPGLRRAIDRLPPSLQVIALELAVALPWALPALVLTLALAPSLAALVWPAIDHCGAHGDHHAHLCALHPPHHASFGAWLLIGLGATWMMLRVGRALVHEMRARDAVRSLVAAAQPAGGGLWTLPTARVICAVAGIRTPVILVSDGARASLDEATLRIAMAHERAHVARFDVARQALARLLATAHIAASATWLLDALGVARERACDESAARVHDRTEVASALLRCARVMDRDLPSAMASFGPSMLEERVRALLDEPRRSPSRGVVGLALVVTSIAALASVPAVHHALETLLGVLAY